MKAFLKSLDERVWPSVENGWERPTTPISEWNTAQKEATSFNSKAMNAIFNVVYMEEFKKNIYCRGCLYCLEYFANCA